ncbi:MAG: ATP-binding cassette domain-containing protein [Firmicutes bacterium]|nr:ATP-binding cassette domain-containing protein [Bacillota bacterium]
MFVLENIKYKDILNIKNLTIPENKITCLIGESGSGKTTLLKLLNKMISPTNGSIHYKNKAIKYIDSIKLRRNVVMLSQTPVIFKGSIKDNLLKGLNFSEKPMVNDNTLKEILSKVHLDKPLDLTAKELSGGEKQRLALGRIMLMNADVYLLDEPSSSLDENTEDIIINEFVKYIKTNNKTLIIVTHSKNIAKTYADNIIEINKGNLKG